MSMINLGQTAITYCRQMRLTPNCRCSISLRGGGPESELPTALLAMVVGCPKHSCISLAGAGTPGLPTSNGAQQNQDRGCLSCTGSPALLCCCFKHQVGVWPNSCTALRDKPLCTLLHLVLASASNLSGFSLYKKTA